MPKKKKEPKPDVAGLFYWPDGKLNYVAFKSDEAMMAKIEELLDEDPDMLYQGMTVANRSVWCKAFEEEIQEGQRAFIFDLGQDRAFIFD